MTFTRRDFLKSGATVAALVAAPRPLLVHLGHRPEPVPPIADPRLKELVGRALDTARAAGAGYADIRLTYTRRRRARNQYFRDEEELAVGVRALADGYWGFASGSVWSANEMARLGREAAHQAKTNAFGKPRVVDFVPAPVVRDGSWAMPVELDPFDVHPSEVMDVLSAMERIAQRVPETSSARAGADFFRQEKAFGSTEGSYCTQRLYNTEGGCRIELEKGSESEVRRLDGLTPTGMGWELFREAPLKEAIQQLIEEVKADWVLPVKPVAVGRYATLFDAKSTASLLDQTLGRATELDRALGYEANAGGTSFLNDPLGMLGSYEVGAPALTVTANRSEPGGCATVEWDDEGVTPDECSLISDGVLTDFQTTRESAGWLRNYYTQQNRPVRSHGCAGASSALFAPLQQAPNLALTPGHEALDFDALVAGMSKGLAITGASINMDYQGLNGLGMGRAYEIRKGKRVARIAGAAFLFRAPELWKGLLALGGKGSARRYGMTTEKGEPRQESYHSVTAVPAVFRQLTIIDALRKA